MRKRKRLVLSFVVLAGIWSASLVAGALAQSPYKVATEAAAETGNWPGESVRFVGGSYFALPFVFITHAKVRILDRPDETLADISIIHVPLLDYWSVRSFSAVARNSGD